MKVLPAFHAALTLMVLPLPVTAQVPQMINFQGRVTTGGTNFNRTGGFKFALIDAAGATT